jgi:hypothetical protein
VFRILTPLLAAALLAGAFEPACAAGDGRNKTLTAFASDAEIRSLFRSMVAAMPRRQTQGIAQPLASPSADMAAPASMMAAKAEATPAAEESVTNNQTAGVDEGGIVKVHGNHLVILRRGRLFTVDVARRQLRPVSAVDAFAPGADPSGTWYDEMLISGDTIVVIGYSYSRGGTEVGLFDIDRAGHIAYRATYHLRSNDYYSSRNYASRLSGNKLIFYTPMYVNLWQADPFSGFPAVRRWRPGATPEEFKRIAPATRIYRTDEPLEPGAGIALHTVSICDLSRREMECQATAVLGPAGRTFYVSANSVYVWTVTGSFTGNQYRPKSGVFRIPLDGSAPTALKVSGAPIDQFSFLESEDRHLNVLVRAFGQGDAMWGGGRGHGGTALLRVPLDMFSDGRDSAPRTSYRSLPDPAGGYAVQNRFVGGYLLYGASNFGDYRTQSARGNLFALRWNLDGDVRTLSLPHAVERIEALGDNAVAVGSDGSNLHFTSVELGAVPQVAGRYIRPHASQGETRSHGFFYKPDSERQGMIGLPVIGNDDSGQGYLRRPSASVLFLRNRSLNLSELGALASRGNESDDGCRASCVDWYGNARPLFLRGRIFALMGYELVEGRLEEERIAEVQRTSFAPDWLSSGP